MKSVKVTDSFGNEYWGDPETGSLHRLDGPAYISGHGGSKEFWIHGDILSKREFNEHPLVAEFQQNQALRELANEI